jgi:chromosomal replication initiator protein
LPGGWAALRDRFRGVALLALDDLHELARSPLGLAELAPTLDALDEAGAVVAVTARSGPGGWRDWPARLVGRLSCGLAVRLDPPGVEALRRYGLERSRGRGVGLTAEAVERLALASDGYRTLDGLIARLALEAKATRRPVDATLAEALDEPGAVAGRPTIEAVAKAVAGRFGVSLRELRSGTRRAAVVGPRHLAMHLARIHTGRSYAAIGTYFGRRDPATVRHACAMAEQRLAADPSLAALAATVLTGGRRPAG